METTGTCTTTVDGLLAITDNTCIFLKGEIVTHKLTGEHCLVLERYESMAFGEDSYAPGYLIRLSDYTTVRVFDFELMKRKD